MDCPSEEHAIQLALGGRPGIQKIGIDLSRREIAVLHCPELQSIESLRKAIPFKTVLLGSRETEFEERSGTSGKSEDGLERRALAWLLGLNFAMFLIETGVGWQAESSGLVADGLDMLADSLVYLLSFLSVGVGLSARIRATRLSAWFQGLLGISALAQAAWRFKFGSEPEPSWMIGISLLALVVNVSCLVLISRFRTGRMHMQASWIFSSNDVVANIGVVAAGVLVGWTGSRYPDLLVGMIICLVVLQGAWRINRLTQSR